MYTPGVALAGTVMVPFGFSVSTLAVPVPVKPCAPLLVKLTFTGTAVVAVVVFT